MRCLPWQPKAVRLSPDPATVWKQLEAIPSGSPVTLEYRQKLFSLAWPIPFFCIRKTDYEIVGVRPGASFRNAAASQAVGRRDWLRRRRPLAKAPTDRRAKSTCCQSLDQRDALAPDVRGAVSILDSIPNDSYGRSQLAGDIIRCLSSLIDLHDYFWGRSDRV